MKYWVTLLVSFPLLWSSGCVDKKTDEELFEESPVQISLVADKRRGFEPLFVSFSAYLETDERQVKEPITDAKWVIKGPRGFFREIMQSSYNYQDESDNQENFFHFDFDFRHPGRYKVRLVLNKGKYASPQLGITVFENSRDKRSRMF